MKVGLVGIVPGNVMNVYRALLKVGIESVEIIQQNTKKFYEVLILPGVGHFQDAMESLKRLNFDEYIKIHVESGGKLLGICLGMQLLFEKSEEVKFNSTDRESEGLKLIKGNVIKLKSKILPHIGWNQITFLQETNCGISKFNNHYFYFVHSYKVVCDKELTIAETEYDGEKIPAIIKYKNIVGIQFHPEKSHTDGLSLLSEVIKC